MSGKSIVVSLAVVIGGIGVFLLLSMPRPLDADQLPDHIADPVNGEKMFWVGGCASCHAAPDAENETRLELTGGAELDTPFGVFRSPNISPDPEHGIGDWTRLDFVNAMVNGISPDGSHYYPAFPYSYYGRMFVEDVIDLKAFLDTLPPSANEVADHELNFPFTVRRGIGLWKLLYLDSNGVTEISELATIVDRGRYLVEGPGHCGACHTPRDSFGGEISTQHLAGARSLEMPEEEGGKVEWIPNITPHEDGLGNWSERDIAYALETGFDPEFDTFGGSMVEVQENIAQLSADDHKAIAAYLKWIPALPSQR